MSCSPEDPKASDAGEMAKEKEAGEMAKEKEAGEMAKEEEAGEMAKEKEADARKRKPTAEPCPDCSDEGEGGGDVAKEPELPPLPVAPSSWPLAASRSRSMLPPSPLSSPPSSPLVASRSRSRLPLSPLSIPPSSYPVAAEAAAKLRRYFDSDTASIPSSADPYIPEILPGIVEGAEQAFVDDEEDEIPYIGDVEPLSSLADEYQSSTSIFQKKIQLLRAKYSAIRRVKRDGNCFYRCFMFAYLEYLLVSQNDAEMGRVLASVERLRQRLFELGKPPIIVSNYCDVFIDMVKRIRKGKMNFMDLLQSCREDTSDDLVKFHRMVAACEMRRREDHYAPFVAGMSNTTVEEYCRRSVEPLGEETESMEIRSLSDALGVPLRLENLDQSLTNGVPELIGFDIQPDNDTTDDDDAQQAPLITLLYRPGHYDILYPIAD